MAASNMRTAFETGAEEVVSQDCEACKLDGKVVVANFFCPECDDHMCANCEIYHKKVKATRNHKVLEEAQMRKRIPESITRPDAVPTSDTMSEKTTYYVMSARIKANFLFLDTIATLLSKRDATYYYDKQKPFKYQTDSWEPHICGLSFMPCGELLASDSANMKLKLFNSDIKMIDAIMFRWPPSDVAAVNDKEAVVTFPTATTPELQYIIIFPQLQLGKKIQLTNNAIGVHVSNKHIYLLCHTGGSSPEVIILDKAGQQQRTIEIQKTQRNFPHPDHIVANRGETKLYVTGSWYSICTTIDGNIVYTTKDETRKGMEGIVVDAYDNVIVCCSTLNEIVIYKPSGVKYRTLLTEADGIKNPKAVAYRASDGLLVIACCAGDSSQLGKDPNKIQTSLLRYRLSC